MIGTWQLPSPSATRRVLGRCARLLLAMALVDVAATPAAPAQVPAADTGAPAAAGKLCIFNASGRTLVAGNQVVRDNGKVLASLPRHTYRCVDLPPGDHVLRPDPYLWKQEVKLLVASGSTYYVVIAYRPDRSWALPLAGPPLVLRQITQQEAEPLLDGMKPR
jgi:hypothetical protein